MASRGCLARLCVSLLAAIPGFPAVAAAATLAPLRWQRLRLGSIRPEGWLRTQVQLQADALTSHLPLFWPEVANSSWLGGASDNVGGLHESTPYWLNGAVPLAFQVESAALRQVVEHYIHGILRRQAPDGWLGPDTDPSDFWSRFPLVLALVQYHEALSDAGEREAVLHALLRFFEAFDARLSAGTRLASWSAARAHDMVWAIHYCVDHAPCAADALLALAARLHAESFDWHGAWFNSSAFPRGPVTGGTSMWTHGVNNAQAIKRGVVWARQSGDTKHGVAESLLAWDMLLRYHGQPNGIFAADEHLAGRMPSRGTELCMVVEAMWSLALVAQASPTDAQAAEALDAMEPLAFNALPGSLSDDLWSHPYLQFANSYQALAMEPDNIWGFDGPDSAMYGLAPNYECCTSNFHQGYPKFVSNLFFQVPKDNTLISAVWAPCRLSTADVGGGLDLELETDYPFGERVRFHIRNTEAFTLKVRVPTFLRTSEGATEVRWWLDGRAVGVVPQDGFASFEIAAQPLESRAALEIEWSAAPVLRESSSAEQGVSVFIGPLLLALDLAERRTQVRRYAYQSADWNTTATLPWHYAIDRDQVSYRLDRRTPGARPYRHSAAECPLAVNVTLALLPESAWPAAHNAPGPLPRAVAMPSLGASEERTLVPYGCTAIRISAFPRAQIAQEKQAAIFA